VPITIGDLLALPLVVPVVLLLQAATTIAAAEATAVRAKNRVPLGLIRFLLPIRGDDQL
jgi:hypothetical protein